MIEMFVLFLAISTITCDINVLYSWKNVVYNDDSIDFPKENAAITGIKYYDNKVYLTVPRFKEGVPYTLNIVGNNELNESVLFPWPNKEIQDLNGGCDKIQNVQSMEIDLNGRMWVIDVGRRNQLTDNPINTCPPKLLIISTSNGDILNRYVFPESVVDYNKTFLNDIVLDVVKEIAYISDAGVGGIIVYDLNKNWSRKYVGKSAKNEPDVSFTILGVDYGNNTFTTPADGIALSPKRDKVIFCALQGLSLYSIETKYLLDRTISDDGLEQYVEKIGKKPSPSDGLAMTESGVLYFGGLTTNSIYKSEFPYDLENGTVVVANDSVKLVWVDTFAFDNKGNILVTANYLNLFKQDPFNETKTYYVLSIDVGERSYMYYKEEEDEDKGPRKEKVVVVVIVSIVAGVLFLALFAAIIYFKDRGDVRKYNVI